MAKVPDFRRSPVPAPTAPAGVAQQLPLDPTQPLPVGKVMITDYTRRQLEAIGWKDGDPIPGNLAERLKAIQQEIAAETASAKLDLPANHKVVMPKPVDIKDLPPEYQAELRQAMDAARAQAAADAEQQAATAAMASQINPAMPSSLREAQLAALQAAAAPTSSIVMSPPRPAPPPQAAPPPPPVAAAAPEHAHDTGASLAPDRCPRCLWDLRMAFEAKPTDHDKEAFVAAILGVTRFQKVVSVFGGRLKLTFRSLTAHESDLLFLQLGYDARAGLIAGDGEYFMKLAAYRLAMSLARIESDGQVTAIIPEISEIPYTKPTDRQETPLVPLLEWFDSEIVNQESLRRIVGQQHRLFQRLVEALEALSSEPDF